MNESGQTISVIMSAYNSEETIKETINSILNQTYKDFELIIVNDKSTDNTESIIKSFKDERIKLINNKKNLGLPASLNKAIKVAKGKYVARMDADDVMLHGRLEKQLAFNLIVCYAGMKETFSEKRSMYKISRKNAKLLDT